MKRFISLSGLMVISAKELDVWLLMVFQVDAEPIKNPVTGNSHRVRIDIPNGFEFTTAEMASGTTKTSGGDIDLPNNNQTHSHMCEIHWNNSGVIRN